MSRFDLTKLKNKKIAILGLGIENIALIKFIISRRIKCSLIICDARDKKQLGQRYKELADHHGNAIIKWRLSADYDNNLLEFDIIMRSPGYPLFSPALQKVNYANSAVDRKKEIEISSPIKLFFQLCPSKNIIGVTGAKGKGTTASLMRHILKKADKPSCAKASVGKRVWLGGNIGVAPFEFINKIKKTDWVILELSSFQLEDMEMSPKIAIFTNFFRDHLSPADPHNPNYHKTMKDYWRAKLNILAWQDKKGTAVINKNLENKKIEFGFGKKIYFIKSQLSSRLIGEHNKENIGAAVAAANLLRVKKGLIAEAIGEFKGLEHRLELVKEKHGIKYYNDSFATMPEAAITAINAFAAPVILLAGGADKGSDFKKLILTIKRQVKLIVLLDGQASSKIKKKLLKAGYPANKIKPAQSMKQAVLTAQENALPDDVILLSPACASFGMFKNYKERGEMFKEEVWKIIKNVKIKNQKSK